MELIRGKKVTVMGLGLHGGGLATVRWLLKNGAKTVIITDLRTKNELKAPLAELKNSKNIEFILGHHRAIDFQEVDLVVKNPGVPKESEYLKIARKNKIPIESDISLFYRFCLSKNIIGITGTKGKSTVASLVYQIFKKFDSRNQIAGNIGTSSLVVLDKITSADIPVVLELSSWQLEDSVHLEISPHIAVITNIMREHLNRHGSMEDYITAKKLIFKFQNENDFLVLNYQDKILQALAQDKIIRPQIIFFNKRPKKELSILNNEMPKLLGNHNLENIMAAISVARIYGLSDEITKKAVLNFKGLSGRLELVKVIKGVNYYNDTTATTPDATIAALQTLNDRLPGRLFLIAGGADKDLDFNDLAKEILKKVERVELLDGDATVKLKRALKLVKFSNYGLNKSLKRAIQNIQSLVEKGDIVLLSPAAASFNMFKNEFDRGDKFVSLL